MEPNTTLNDEAKLSALITLQLVSSPELVLHIVLGICAMRISWVGVVAALLCIAIIGAQPSGFEDRLVLDGGDLGGGMVVDFAWTPPEAGGQLIVIKKEGEIQVYDDPAGDNSYSEKSVALDLSPVLCANSERGVEGIEVHPDFATNRYM